MTIKLFKKNIFLLSIVSIFFLFLLNSKVWSNDPICWPTWDGWWLVEWNCNFPVWYKIYGDICANWKTVNVVNGVLWMNLNSNRILFQWGKILFNGSAKIEDNSWPRYALTWFPTYITVDDWQGGTYNEYTSMTCPAWTYHVNNAWTALISQQDWLFQYDYISPTYSCAKLWGGNCGDPIFPFFDSFVMNGTKYFDICFYMPLFSNTRAVTIWYWAWGWWTWPSPFGDFSRTYIKGTVDNYHQAYPFRKSSWQHVSYDGNCTVTYSAWYSWDDTNYWYGTMWFKSLSY